MKLIFDFIGSRGLLVDESGPPKGATTSLTAVLWCKKKKSFTAASAVALFSTLSTVYPVRQENGEPNKLYDTTYENKIVQAKGRTDNPIVYRLKFKLIPYPILAIITGMLFIVKLLLDA
jgi:hypothetical protein